MTSPTPTLPTRRTGQHHAHPGRLALDPLAARHQAGTARIEAQHARARRAIRAALHAADLATRTGREAA